MIYGKEVLNDIKLVQDLYRRSHDSELSDEMFKWKYLNNPHGTAVGWTVREHEGGELIGLEVLFPRKRSFNGKVYLGAQSGDTMVDQAHRRKGIFMTLLQNTIADFEGEGFHFIYGVPNAMSANAFLKTDIFEIVSPITQFRKYWTGASFSKRMLKSNMLSNLAEPAIQLWLKSKDKLVAPTIEIKEQISSHHDKKSFFIDDEWIKWRSQAPGKQFLNLAWEGGNATLALGEEQTANLYHLHLGPHAESALRSFVDYCGNLNLSALYFDAHVDDATQALLLKTGFIINSAVNDYLIYASNNPDCQEIYDPKQCVYFRHDLDMP